MGNPKLTSFAAVTQIKTNVFATAFVAVASQHSSVAQLMTTWLRSLHLCLTRYRTSLSILLSDVYMYIQSDPEKFAQNLMHRYIATICSRIT